MGSRMFGKYVLERELAEGGMARVFSATLRGTDGFEKPLVVKVIKDEFSYDPEFVKRFVAEAKTTVALTHPNIVAVYELGSEGGTYFLAMEHVNGISARELLSSTGRLTPAEGAYLGAEICRALDYAHRKMNVVHRDITPRNVMIDEEGQIKLIDFGIAATSHLSGQTILGTPGHMPPEQFTSSSIGPEADLFAVGALLLELWSGTAPFRRESAEASQAALNDRPPQPSDIDPALAPLDEIVGRAMKLDPKERPDTAEELGRPLRSFLAGVDSADLSRALAEKVRAARAQEDPVEGVVELAPITRRSQGTQTFATRPEVSDIAPPGTRKIPSLAPHAPSERSAQDQKAPHTVRRGPFWIGVAIVLALVAIAATQLRGAHSRGSVPPPASAPALSASATVDLEMPRVDPVPLPEPKVPAPISATGQGAPLASPPVSSAANEGRAALTLMGDPGTRATVDGIAKGLCPVKLTVPPGPHEIRFTFDATGESRGERITAKPNERLSVFADFASATPRIRTERD